MIEYRLRSGIAQLAERLSVKEDVVGSSPTPGAKALIIRIMLRSDDCSGFFVQRW